MATNSHKNTPAAPHPSAPCYSAVAALEQNNSDTAAQHCWRVFIQAKLTDLIKTALQSRALTILVGLHIPHWGEGSMQTPCQSQPAEVEVTQS